MGVIKGETGLRVAVGIDLGGTFIKGAIVDEQGHLLVKDEVATQSVRGSEWILQRIIQLTKDLIVKSGVDASFVTGLGIGIPGFIDSDLGVAIEVINIGWHDVAVVEPLQTALHMPVYMENDANLAALGESFAGAGRGFRSALCITLGTGVGGGIVIDGHVLQGASHMAGEIGHLVLDPQGAPCNCGHYGCLETVSSATGVVRLVHEGIARGEVTALEYQQFTAADVFAAANHGDELAQQVILVAAETLGRGLAMAANLLNPDVIVIGGGMARAGEILFAPVRKSFQSYALQRVSQAVRIVPALLGNDAGVVGAGKLALYS